MEFITTLIESAHLTSLKDAGITTVLIGERSCATRIPSYFSWEEIKQIKQTCDKLGLKLGAMMNCIFFDSQIDNCAQVLKEYANIGVDCIEYSDPCVYIEAQKQGLTHLLTYNPDTLNCNYLDVQAMLDTGIKSAVLSKEITCDEMVEIRENTQGEIEAIVFGRQVMSYSKRRMLTNYMEYLGKNIDLHNKKDLWLIETTRSGRMPIIQDEHGTAIFSETTLGAYEYVTRIVTSGITRLRLDNQFIDHDVFILCCKAFKEVLFGANGKEVFDQINQNYPQLNLSSGYMNQKTNLVK